MDYALYGGGKSYKIFLFLSASFNFINLLALKIIVIYHLILNEAKNYELTIVSQSIHL